MNKTILEKRIEERANERFEDDLRKFIDFLLGHPISKELRVKIGEENIPIANFGSNYGLLNNEGLHNRHSAHTNLEIVKRNLIEKYKKEETDKILEQLESFNYLFNQ